MNLTDFGVGELPSPKNIEIDFTSFGVDFTPIFLIVGLIVLTIIMIYIARAITRHLYNKNNLNKQIIYLVRLPKEDPNENESGSHVQNMQEDVAIGEILFSAIGGLRAQRGLRAWLLGRSDHFSFEIVATKKKISFYIVTPANEARYLEQQIQAHYPEAVMEKVSDYNIFSAQGEILAGNITTKRHHVFPIKTYKKMETDPINTILNVMSKLDDDDGIALQLVSRSAKSAWHRKASEVVRKAYKTMSMAEAARVVNSNSFLYFLSELFSQAKPKKDDQSMQQQQMKRLTQMEEEQLKNIEEKNSKAGLDVNIRVIVSSRNPGKTHMFLDNLNNAFSQYNNYEYGNSFKNKISLRHQKRSIRDFIYRNFDENIHILLNTEECTSIFHLPLKDAETPNILWLTAKHAAAPTNIPSEGVILGRNVYRGVNTDIQMMREDRRRHMYVIGKSGTGKSVYLSNMAIQDIENGEGICLLDPHGDLVSDILERVPPERAEDVIVFAPADIERPLALNLLEYDQNYPEQKTFVINEMIKIFDKLYDLKATGGPIFEQYMRNSMLLIMDDPNSGSTLMEIPKVLADADYRKKKLDACKNETVVNFWVKEAEKAGGDAALANVVPYITSKLTTFIANDTMRPIIGQQKSSFDFRQIMDEGKILLVDLSKGAIGEINAYLLGLIIIGKILMASLSRTDMQQEKRKDFYLYIDEFQNFTTDSICTILSEARKYGLNLTIAHQYIGQLVDKGDTAIKDAVFGNVGTLCSFKIGTEDAEVLEKEYGPVFNQYDLINIEKGAAYVKLLIDNTASKPFSMKTIWPIMGTKHDGLAEKIKTLSRFKYGRDRNIIEAEIKRRTIV